MLRVNALHRPALHVNRMPPRLKRAPSLTTLILPPPSFQTGNVLLSTVRSSQAGCVGFQKLPFIAVVGGEPVWTACGKPTSGAGGNETTSSHSSLPATAQRANVAVLMYRRVGMMLRMALKSDVYAYLPSSKFEEFTPCPAHAPLWTFAKRQGCYIGLYGSHADFLADAEPYGVISREPACHWGES